MKLHDKRQTVLGVDIYGRIVIFFDEQRVSRQKVFESVQWWGVGAPCHLQVVVVNVFVS